MKFVQFDFPWHCTSIFTWLLWFKRVEYHRSEESGFILRIFGFRYRSGWESE